MRTAITAGLVGLLATGAMAQTYTDCDPTKKSCPADAGLTTYRHSVDFTEGESPDWVMTSGKATYDPAKGAGFTISATGDSPTMQSNFYMFFGTVTAMVRAAPGKGIVSCVILESDCLDEVDWEWLGGDVNQVQTNYFGKGNTTTYDRGTYVAVASGTQAAVQNYTLEWTEKATVWYVNGQEVRRLAYGDALGGANYPQTPMRIKLGDWIAADTGNAGTAEWAGGKPDYASGPFTMWVESIDIVNYNPATTYTYGDLTGSYASIVQANGTDKVVTTGPKKNSAASDGSLANDSDNQLSAANDTASKTTVTAVMTPTQSSSSLASQTATGHSNMSTSTPGSSATTVPDSLAASVAAPLSGAAMAVLSLFAFMI